MRPIKLIMNAFGPFAQTQTLDFQIMKDKGLFLITGPTGSGKTTILDAIAFALYGDASGDTRESQFLKSDFVDIAEECSVEFTFQVQNKIYHIWRSPIQNRLKRDGSAKVVNSKAIFTLPNGDIYERVSVVNDKIVEILGLTKDQFKKLIVLPQGEFRKLLLAKSDEKQAIFRHIFGTALYDRIASKLQEKTKELSLSMNTINTYMKTNVANIDFSGNEELRQQCEAEYIDIVYILELLKKSNAADKKQIGELKASIDTLSKQKEAINIQYAMEINDKFDKLKQATLQLSALDMEQPLYKDNKEMYEKLSLLKDMIPLEQAIERDSKNTSRIKTAIKETAAILSQLEKQLLQSQKEYKALPVLQEKADTITKNLAQLAQYEVDYQNMTGDQKKLKITKKALLENDKKIQYTENLIKRYDIVTPYETAQKLELLLHQFLNNLNHWIQINKAHNAAKAEHTKAMELFLSNQSGILAEQLQNNMPCPVCGSSTHPAPAKRPPSNISQAAIDLLEQKRSNKEKELDGIKTKCAQTLARLHECDSLAEVNMDNIGKNLSMCKDTYQQTKQLCESYRKELSAYENELQKHPLYTSGDFEQSEDGLAKQIQGFQQKKVALQTEKDNFLQSIQRYSSKIPNELLNENAIIQKINELKKQREELVQKQQRITKEYQSVQSQYDKNDQKLIESQKQLEQYTKQLQESQAHLREKRKTAGLTNDLDYAERKEKLPQIESIRQWVGEYEKKRAIAKESIRTLDKELENKQKYDIDKMNMELHSLQKKLTDLNEQYIPCHTKYSKNTDAYVNLKKNWKESESVQKQYAHYSQLYAVTSGKNEARVSFERYILASYFDDIIQCANLRLQKMTNKRYALSRKMERQKGGGASGLDLEVLDVYSGRLRPVTTLSGGETFMTSLALALGMADVVSQNAGGVEMNTMFIDEGFGTLDSETLNNAINCLTQLQDGGRLVGIISHVSGLEERIHRKLVVTPSAGGSSAQFIV